MHSWSVLRKEREVIVPVYNWLCFLGKHFRKFPGIKSYHHFEFTAVKPGKVTVKLFSDSESSEYRLLTDDSWVPSAGELPDVVSPSGLSEEHQWYLHDQIRDFCREGTEDLACSLPAVPRQSHPVTTPEEEERLEEEAPQAKRPRL